MRELHSYGKVGHIPIHNWLEACQNANAEELVKEAQVAKAVAEQENDSPRVWVDADRYVRVLGEEALVAKPLSKGQPKKGTINPKFLKPKEDVEQRQFERL